MISTTATPCASSAWGPEVRGVASRLLHRTVSFASGRPGIITFTRTFSLGQYCGWSMLTETRRSPR